MRFTEFVHLYKMGLSPPGRLIFPEEALEVRAGDLRGADFSYANLCGADFSGVDLTDADFSYAILRRCRFTSNNFTRANFTCVDFEGSTLHQNHTGGTTFTGCGFRGTTHTDMLYSDEQLASADFSEAKRNGVLWMYSQMGKEKG